jgi:hypothetical protein
VRDATLHEGLSPDMTTTYSAERPSLEMYILELPKPCAQDQSEQDVPNTSQACAKDQSVRSVACISFGRQVKPAL